MAILSQLYNENMQIFTSTLINEKNKIIFYTNEKKKTPFLIYMFVDDIYYSDVYYNNSTLTNYTDKLISKKAPQSIL